jgi:hypothetical protein
VVDRDLLEHEAAVVELLHHLERKRSVAGRELDGLETAPADEAEVAVHVADAVAERQLHQVLIDAAEDDAMERVVPADLVPVHDVDAGPHVRQEQL